MPNRFFNNIVNLIAGTKARAGDVEADFTAVSAGFDAVQTEMDGKAPVNNAALTGSPTAPTPAAGTSNNQIATTQFVTSAALSSSLPGQAGNAGRFISTDGTNAFWAVLSIAWAGITGKPSTLAGYGIDPVEAREDLGSTTVGDAIFTASSASAARSALGATATGSGVFTATDAAAARSAIGAQQAGSYALTSEVDALRDVATTAAAASYTLVLGDRGKSIDFTGAAAQTITIPANASVAFPVGSVVTITNNSANSLAIAITTDTLRQGGTANVGTRTLAPYGVATARKVSSTVWIIVGSGLT